MASDESCGNPFCPEHGSSDRGEFGHPGIGGMLGLLGSIFPGATVIPIQFGDNHKEELTDDEPVNTEGYAPEPSRCVITRDEVSLEFPASGLGNSVPATTDDARFILGLVPTILQDFLVSNAKYARAQTGHDLGAKGIIPDINRKVSVLISRLWHDEHAGRDSTEEIIDDLIGHLLLMRARLR